MHIIEQAKRAICIYLLTGNLSYSITQLCQFLTYECEALGYVDLSLLK
jgi:hypothetical protein